MKNLIEVIKTNKVKILKRSLIVVGSIAGLFVVSKVLTTKHSVDLENYEVDEEATIEDSDEEDSDEEC